MGTNVPYVDVGFRVLLCIHKLGIPTLTSNYSTWKYFSSLRLVENYLTGGGGGVRAQIDFVSRGWQNFKYDPGYQSKPNTVSRKVVRSAQPNSWQNNHEEV